MEFREELNLKQSKDILKRLLKYSKPYKTLLIFAIISMLLVTILDLSAPYLIKISIDKYIMGFEKPLTKTEKGIDFRGEKYSFTDEDSPDNFNIIQKDNKFYFGQKNDPIEKRKLLSEKEYKEFRKNHLAGLKKISKLYFLTILGVFLFSFVQEYILSITSQKIIYKIRKDVYNHIISRSISYFDKNAVGRLTTRTTNDVENLNEMYTSVMVSFFQDLFIIFGIVIIMFIENSKLALISMFIIPLIIILVLKFRIIMQSIYRKSRVVLAKINTDLNMNINGMAVIQAFKKEELIYNKFKALNENYFSLNKEETKANAKFQPSISILRFISMASLIYFGGKMVLKNEIEIGVLFLFINYVGKFFRPILDLTEKYNILQVAISSSERIFSILDDDREIKNPEKPIKIKDFKGKIEFKNVWFAYNSEDWVLKDISFTINPKESVAFVGTTGSGKTSIISLIQRFYDIQKGEILIDGKDIKSYDKHELRSQMALVDQDVFLFSGDIKSNLFGTSEEIKKAAKYSHADKFIKKLPKKYSEKVTERGSTFSEGERQLLAITRALVQNPKILILDEATANIDVKTESLIQDALSKILKNRTNIAVAHRLSTIQNSDKIIVLQKGRIIESGNHQELLEKKGIYYDLFRLQYKI